MGEERKGGASPLFSYEGECSETVLSMSKCCEDLKLDNHFFRYENEEEMVFWYNHFVNSRQEMN